MGTFSQIFRTIGNNSAMPTNKHIPMINSITNSLSGYLSSTGQLTKKKNLMNWYKGIPELTGLVNKVAKDIVYKFHFENINPSESGRNKIQQANRFAQEVGLRKQMFEQMVDSIVTGESFGWMGKLPLSVVKQAVDNALKKEIFYSKTEKKMLSTRLLKEIKSEEGLANINGIDEDLLRPRKYRVLPSTTMEIIYNAYDIEKYVQTVGTTQEEFNTKEVIHFTQMSVDGKVNGFTPIESVVVQLELLRQMWQNNLSLHKNGGHADKLYILENEKVGTPSYKRIEEQLRKYKLVENTHGSMLFTGKVDVKELSQMDDMLFQNLGLYITGLLAMQWEIPKSSIPSIVKGSNTKDDNGGNSERGYWRNVQYMQQDFADVMNTQLWIPHFGVKIIFENAFVQHDIQFEAARMQKFNNILTIDSILAANDKQLKESTRLSMLGITSADIEEKPEQEIMLDETNAAKGIGTNAQLGAQELNTSDADKNKAAKKRKEQEESTVKNADGPNGITKELDFMREIEYKEILGKDAEILTPELFLEKWIELKRSEEQTPSVFISTSTSMMRFIFKSDKVYKTTIGIELQLFYKSWTHNFDGYLYKL